jgi:hypothetical protein
MNRPRISKGGAMRSLWRIMALRWLGGQASHGLTGDVALLDLFMAADPLVTAGFRVRRESEVSHRAMISASAPSASERDAVSEEFAQSRRGREKADP